MFLHVYEAGFLWGLLNYKDRKLAQTSYSCFRYVLSLNNSRFGKYLHLVYLNVFESKDTTDTQKSSCFDLHREFDNEGRLQTKLRLHFSNSQLPFIVIFQHHLSIEFIFHNTLLFLRLVPSTVFFLTYFGKASKATLLWVEVIAAAHIYGLHHDLVDRYNSYLK